MCIVSCCKSMCGQWTLILVPCYNRISNRNYSFSIQPLTILGVTGPFSVLAENIYSLCVDNFNV